MCEDCGKRFTTFELDIKQVIKIQADALNSRLTDALHRSINEEVSKLIDSNLMKYIVEDKRINNLVKKSK